MRPLLTRALAAAVVLAAAASAAHSAPTSGGKPKGGGAVTARGATRYFYCNGKGAVRSAATPSAAVDAPGWFYKVGHQDAYNNSEVRTVAGGSCEYFG